MKVVHVTDVTGVLVAPEWLARAEAVHRQLRPQLPAEYAQKMARVFKGGARMLVAAEGDRVLGVAVWRAYENTFYGKHLYVDDLVTDENTRSKGVGKLMLDECARLAQELECDALTLDSGVQRQQAHKFYFREKMTIVSFHFKRGLK